MMLSSYKSVILRHVSLRDSYVLNVSNKDSSLHSEFVIGTVKHLDSGLLS